MWTMPHSLHFWLRSFLLLLSLLSGISLAVTVLKPSQNGRRNWRWLGSLTKLNNIMTFGGRVNLHHDMLVYMFGFISCLVWVQVTETFHARPQVHWKVIREYPIDGRIGYDIELPGGDVTRNFIPCEYRGLHPGMVIISAGFRDRGDCLSFAGMGWMKIERREKGELDE